MEEKHEPSLLNVARCPPVEVQVYLPPLRTRRGAPARSELKITHGACGLELSPLSGSPPPSPLPQILPSRVQQRGEHILWPSLIVTVRPWKPGARFLGLDVRARRVNVRMPPPGTPQVIYNQTTSLGSVFFFFF